MLMISHFDGLTSRRIFFISVIHLHTSAKTDSAGPHNVASYKYHMLISDDSDDVVEQTTALTA